MQEEYSKTQAPWAFPWGRWFHWNENDGSLF